MNEIIKKEQKARKFLKNTIGCIGGNSTFFVYYFTKIGKEELFDQLETIDASGKEAHDIIDEYEKALKELKHKIGRFSVFCDFSENDYVYEYCGGEYGAFITTACANRKYFEPIDKLSEETLEEIFKQNLTIEQLAELYNIDPKMFEIETVSVDSCLED